jgi:hypothetical protein
MERIADGLSYEEIAQDLGKSREVVRSRLCDARARLIQILNPDGGSAGRPRPATARHSPEGAHDWQERPRHAHGRAGRQRAPDA